MSAELTEAERVEIRHNFWLSGSESQRLAYIYAAVESILTARLAVVEADLAFSRQTTTNVMEALAESGAQTAAVEAQREAEEDRANENATLVHAARAELADLRASISAKRDEWTPGTDEWDEFDTLLDGSSTALDEDLAETVEGCDCIELCSMGPTCPGGYLARLAGSGCHRWTTPRATAEELAAQVEQEGWVDAIPTPPSAEQQLADLRASTRLTIARVRVAADLTVDNARAEHGDDLADWLDSALHAHLARALQP